MNSTAAVIVTYNRKALLKECLLALLSQTTACDILVIDNHSTDGTAAAVEDIIKDKSSNERRITYIDTGANLGGAGGFSYGIKEAAQRGYEYIWIMDDDCVPEPDALEELFSAAAKLEKDSQGSPDSLKQAEQQKNVAYKDETNYGSSPESAEAIGQKSDGSCRETTTKPAFGFLASKVLWTDGTLCKTNIQRYPMAKRVTDFDSELVRVNYSSFVSMFFKSDIVRELGLPIKEFFIWSDDLEYTRRISMKYPCWLCNKSVVVHKCKGNYGINIAVELPERVDRYRYIYRNDVYVFRKEGLKGIAYVVVRDIYHVFKVLLFAKSGKLSKIKTIIGGTLSGIAFNPAIERVLTENDNA